MLLSLSLSLRGKEDRLAAIILAGISLEIIGNLFLSILHSRDDYNWQEFLQNVDRSMTHYIFTLRTIPLIRNALLVLAFTSGKDGMPAWLSPYCLDIKDLTKIEVLSF